MILVMTIWLHFLFYSFFLLEPYDYTNKFWRKKKLYLPGKAELTIKMPNRLETIVIARAKAEFPPTSCNCASCSQSYRQDRQKKIIIIVIRPVGQKKRTCVNATPLDKVVGMQQKIARPIALHQWKMKSLSNLDVICTNNRKKKCSSFNIIAEHYSPHNKHTCDKFPRCQLKLQNNLRKKGTKEQNRTLQGKHILSYTYNSSNGLPRNRWIRTKKKGVNGKTKEEVILLRI